MLGWFNIILGIMVLAIIGFIVNAVRKTHAEIDKGIGPEPSERNMKRVIEEIRKRDIQCPRCGKEAFAMLGINKRYQCDTCNYEFEGAEHFPSRSG